MNLVPQVQQRLTQLNQLIQILEHSLKTAPKGNLKISTKNGKPEYYLREARSLHEDHPIYLGKGKIVTASSLAQRDYEKALFNKAQLEKTCLENFLAGYSDEELVAVYDQLSPARKSLVTPLEVSSAVYAEEWQAKEYIPKEFWPEDYSEFYTNRGERVRSKSEIMIADALFKHGVPYRYEAPLKLNGITIHPDFTVLNLRTRQEIYWEHFGLMDDSEYAQRAVSRLAEYNKAGYFLGDHLVITMESKALPLSTKQLECVVRSLCN